MAKPRSRASTRPTLREYERMFPQQNGSGSFEQIENHFGSCRDRAASQLQLHPFWVELRSQIAEWDAQYRTETGAESLYKGTFGDQAVLHQKNWQSAFQKAYRKNVLNNRNWPNPPVDGFVTSTNWFEKVGDILRTQFVCRYIDGVKFLLGRIQALAEKHSLEIKPELQATTEGYYAGHIDVYFDFTIVDSKFNSVPCRGGVEIQITTQLKEVVKQLLHAHYENDRLLPPEDKPTQWQWDYRRPSFDANYLGHVVHYLEAQILKLRDGHGSSKT